MQLSILFESVCIKVDNVITNGAVNKIFVYSINGSYEWHKKSA
jgi:hypothetical protein